MDASDLDDAKMRYHFALAPEDYDRLPFYSALLLRLEEDALALELLASVRVEQRNPMIILAILQFAALRGHEVLGPIYEEARLGPLHDFDFDDSARRVLEVIHDTPELVRGELWRSTQTNEPGRSAVLQAVISDLAVGVTSPLNVIEVGASAGINLCFDQFPVRAHDDGNPLTLICEDVTPVDRARTIPNVASRVGIDPRPLDLASEEDRRWLKSCIWPEERRRHERFDAIVAARPSWPKASLLTGRALERLDEAFALGNPDNLTVVFNTWVAFYFTPEERTEYFAQLQRRCHDSNVAWVSIESSLVNMPGVEADKEPRHRGASQIVLTRPGSRPSRWGWCHAHGRWLEKTAT